MGTEGRRVFDFYDITRDGDLPPNTRVVPEDGTPFTVNWAYGIEEGFEYGWNKATTYDLYRRRVESLLTLAAREDVTDDDRQTLLASAIVLTVSGLETLVSCAVGKRRKEHLKQSMGDFVREVQGLPGYSAPDPRDVQALDRMLEVRHSIVHAGWRITPPLQGKINGRVPVEREILLGLPEVRTIVAGADRFAACIEPSFPTLLP